MRISCLQSEEGENDSIRGAEEMKATTHFVSVFTQIERIEIREAGEFSIEKNTVLRVSNARHEKGK